MKLKCVTDNSGRFTRGEMYEVIAHEDKAGIRTSVVWDNEGKFRDVECVDFEKYEVRFIEAGRERLATFDLEG